MKTVRGGSDEKKKIAAVVREELVRQGLTTEMLAQRADLADNTVAALTNPAKTSADETIYKVSEALFGDPTTLMRAAVGLDGAGASRQEVALEWVDANPFAAIKRGFQRIGDDPAALARLAALLGLSRDASGAG